MLENICERYSRGTRNWQRKSYQIQVQASICRNNHLHLDYIFLYCCVLTPKNSCFCPSKCPRDKKGQKITSLECTGAQPGDKIDFLAKRKNC